MASCPHMPSTEVGSSSQQHGFPAIVNSSKCSESPLEPEGDEDEDEDVDFNPFLKETLSMEASSSLSSEIEGLDADAIDSGGNISVSVGCSLSSKVLNEVQEFPLEVSEHGDAEIVMQTLVSSKRLREQDSSETVSQKCEKGTSVLTSLPDIETACEKENGSSSGTDFVDVTMVRQVNNTTESRENVISIDDNDAICMRTRARYSLASFTLDELETFLQETDDDNDFQNVDDEEEYRKFLAAVLLGGDGDGKSAQERENVDDEDEDNDDADFQIEIEEALESDLDENTKSETHNEEYEAAGRRPETRQNSRRKASNQSQRRFLEQAKRPLRPLLPIMPNAPLAPFPAFDGMYLTSETASHCPSSIARDGFVNGFTPHQIGQLHCLIHEHMQLLIQVFSLCVLEPSRQHVASQVQGLLSEMIHKRDQVVAWRSMSYPSSCFHPPYIHPSVPDEISKVVSSQTNEGSVWVPYVSGPIRSILDVAPLNLVGRYMDDVSTAKLEYQRHHLERICDSRFEKEPLFPLPSSFDEANGEVARGTIAAAANSVPLSSPRIQLPKKSLAAALVESTKKQSVALVPKEIVKLAQIFFPLFNPALFPHKPPPVPVANRVLFTDAEDELLALGLMEYNTDWKAIQQRFLPCKSKHQIFVRQKNCCSSKASENPIKAVRKMKTSPLTAEEIARIHEGLRVYKLDWMSIWKLIVPHRDPSLLPRQWRIALGTQKSYKTSSAKKEKRRLYELNRRRSKAAASEKEDNQIENDGGENNSGDEYIDNEDEAYVHEAFLADWRPNTSRLVSSESPTSNHKEQSSSSGLFLPDTNHLRGNINVESQSQNGNMHKFLAATNAGHLHTLSHSTHPNHPISNLSSKSSKPQVVLRPYRVRRTNSARLVKLAPDLPPVNLPPSVRVISQSAFKSYQIGMPVSSVDGGVEKENVLLLLPHEANSGSSHSVAARLNKIDTATIRPQQSGLQKDKCAEERGTGSDLQMHPLLFQAPQNGCLPYHQLNCSTGIPNFSFSSGNHPELNLGLFHNSHHTNSTNNYLNKSLKSKEPSLTSCGIDFHPLLQRTDDINGALVAGGAADQQCADLYSFGDKCAEIGNPSDIVLNEPQASGGQLAIGGRSSCLNDKANELDLEIHLSSTSSRKEKARGNGDVIEHNQTGLTVSASNKRNVMDTQNANSRYYVHSGNCPVASVQNGISDEIVLGVHASSLPSNNICIYGINNIADQSLPGIVMEQEELSDSDDEIGEHVEFECEEMADSEGEEGSDCEPVANAQNKVLNAAMEDVIAEVEISDHQGEPIIHGNIPGDGCVPVKDGILKLGLTGQEKDTSTLLSNIKTSGAVWPLGEKSRRVESRNGKSPAENNVRPSRPKRSYRKTTPSKQNLTLEGHDVDVPLQVDLGSPALSSSKKPRKRACRIEV